MKRRVLNRRSLADQADRPDHLTSSHFSPSEPMTDGLWGEIQQSCSPWSGHRGEYRVASVTQAFSLAVEGKYELLYRSGDG